LEIDSLVREIILIEVKKGGGDKRFKNSRGKVKRR